VTASPPSLTNPANLLAIANAARRIGDRDLERAAIALLRDEHHIDVTFRDKRRPPLRLEVGDDE
jgi:hypothetical protein